MTKLLPVLVAALVALAMNGCAPRVDVEAERAALRNTDIESSKAAAAKDLERMVTFYAADAAMFPPNASLVTGQEAIRALWAQLMASPGYALSWQATRAEVSGTGDLGYTVGTYEFTINDPQGQPVTERGKYVAVWKKQPDRTWKIVADIYNSNQPPPPAAPR